jgi:hypothetical protein
MIHVTKKVADFYIKKGIPVSHVTKPNSEIVTGNYTAKKEVQGMNKFNSFPEEEKDNFYELYDKKDWKSIKALFKKYGIIKCTGCTRTSVIKSWANHAVENDLI